MCSCRERTSLTATECRRPAGFRCRWWKSAEPRCSLPGMSDTRAALGLRPIINVSGTMTALGASIVVPEAVRGRGRRSCRNSSRSTTCSGAPARRSPRHAAAEAGFVTASAAAGITLAVAGCMTGRRPRRDRAAAGRARAEERGARSSSATWSATARRSTRRSASPAPRWCRSGRRPTCARYQLEGAISERTRGGLFVVSHHTVQIRAAPARGGRSRSRTRAACR